MVKGKVRAKRIFCVVAYDIQSDKNRIKIAKLLEKYGVRVNFSVFECMFTESQLLYTHYIPSQAEKNDRVNTICLKSLAKTRVLHKSCISMEY